MQEIIRGQNFKNPAEVYSFLKDTFKDALQEMLEGEMVSKITEHVVPERKKWQSRPLERVYLFIFMDAIHNKIRDEACVVNKAAYVVMSINIEGNKDILGI